MDELENSVGLLPARFNCGTNPNFYDTQVVAMMFDSGVIRGQLWTVPDTVEYAAGAWFYEAAAMFTS